MTEIQIGRSALKVLNKGEPDALLGRVALKVINKGEPTAQLGRVALKVLWKDENVSTLESHMGRVALKVSSTNPFLISVDGTYIMMKNPSGYWQKVRHPRWEG